MMFSKASNKVIFWYIYMLQFSIYLNATVPRGFKETNIHLLDHSTCGKTITKKVVGGRNTTIFEFPWIAMLMYHNYTDNRNASVCSGTLISKRYVLTAAHCVTNLPQELTLLNVKLGEHDTSSERDCLRNGTGHELICADRYKVFGIEKIHYHPEYSKIDHHHDIGLLRLDKQIEETRSIKPICLPLGSAAKIMKPWMVIIGWGKTELSKRSEILLKAAVELIPYEECSKAYFNSPNIINSDHICAGSMRNKDSCQGDSGGPLQAPGLYEGDARYVKYGVVTFGKECGNKNIPGVYTNVTAHTMWILNTIKQ